MKLLKLIVFICMCITIEQSFGYQIGEKLVFSIRYGIITAGEASLEITEHVFKDSIPTYRILSKARTNSFFDNVFRVRDELESIWEKKNLVTLQFTKRMHEGNYRQHRAHYYYPKQNLSIYMRFNSKSGTSKEETMEIPDNTQDVLSAFYWLRLQDLVVGGEYIINVTADGRNYPAKVIVHNIEKLNTIIGKKDCFVVEPILEGEAIFKQTGKILIWLTADENKIPVKMTSQIVFGSFRAELIEIKNVSYK